MEKNERTKNASRNILWGMLAKIISVGLPFATRTVMMYTMGMQYVGLGSLFTSILQVLSFTELGVGGALIFSMYKPIAEGDDDQVCALLNFYRKAYLVIGCVILAIGMAMMPFLKHLIAADMPGGIQLQKLFVIYLLNNVLGYILFAHHQALFIASQRADVISKVAMGFQLLSGIAQILVLVLLRNYYAFAIVIPVITCLNNICIWLLSKRHYPQYRCRGRIQREELRAIEKKVGGMVFQKIGGIVLTSVDTIVISAFLGLVPLALYQNYYYIITALFGFLTVIMQSIVAGVGNSVVSETVEKNYGDFQKFNLLYVWIISWCTTCLLCLYQPFMQLWVGEENMLGLGMVVLFALYFFVHKWCDMLYVYQEACGIWWETKYVPLLAAIMNLVVNILLIQTIGLPGILISTIVAILLIYDTGYARVLFRTYFAPIANGIRRYWIRQISYLLTAAAACAITILVCSALPLRAALAQLVVNGIVCLIVPNIIFLLVWKRLPEFGGAMDMVKNAAGRWMRK